ncbi:NADH-ubiquinone reductase complex 1 MLRQ subunit [Quillaja saponaria]|uniref:NADH-ubiquinone reductase complex 1 MLRQ subunit n=1 Tax=Quillaja saponaria TaxID=32244 RepID=A0AAD7KSW2_QUISA|nr:NADH-ubiquinone reductase complex 1 MLRQ subunit [Quillaja saponaria]
MAFRSTMGYLKTLMGNTGLRGGIGSRVTYTTSTTPKMKTYSPTRDHAYVHQHHQKAGAGESTKSVKGDFVPVYVSIGMISLSVILGLYTAKQQLMHSPTVYVKKERRKTLPEVVEPEHVAEEAEKFFEKSFFRKVAHVQDADNADKQVIPDPIRKDAYAYRPKIVTLQSVGVDPKNV